jgi:aspartyl-tRNA(Asn)/glutamyl-tRNA(Gln) amidotransferase subunit A
MLTLAGLQHELTTGGTTSLAVVDDLLARIDETESRLNAYVCVNREGARSAARALDGLRAAGTIVGPLHGIPIAVKDLLDTHDLPTSAGGRPVSDTPPAKDATVVAKLRSAGAIVIGKTNTHEYAYGYTTENPHHGDTHNPWDLGRIPGGSSGGSAASVSAGSAIAAIGTDTGGSVRVPASLCGIVGLKPTFGRVGRAGVFPLAWTLDHVGPLTRTARDCAILLSAIAGTDQADSSTLQTPPPLDYASALERDVTGLRVGVPTNHFFDAIDPEVAAAVRSAIDTLANLGAIVTEITIPGLEDAVAAWLTILLSEATSIHETLLHDRPDDYGEDVRGFVEAGALVPAISYLRAQRIRQRLAVAFKAAMEPIDVLITPATALPAPQLGTSEVTINGHTEPLFQTFARISAPLDVVGLPAVSTPCGLTASGLPIGLQIVGHPFDEATVLAAAHNYDQNTGHTDNHPSLPHQP